MNPPGLGLSALFDRAPAEAIAYLQQKQVLPSLDWWEVLDGAHAQAFAVAHLARLDLLEDIRQSLVAALQKGTTFAQWSAQLEPYLQAKGWWGKQVFVDGQGNAKVATVGSPHRMETIYRTNLQSAYMAGRRAQMLEAVDTHPYWRYVAVMDARTRPSHRALHGRVMAADDPAWDSIFPPCGFNCRCRVAPMTPQGVERGGYAVESSAGHMRTEVVGVGPGTTSTTITRLQLPSMDQAFKTDPGFNHAPEVSAKALQKLAQARHGQRLEYPADKQNAIIRRALGDQAAKETPEAHLGDQRFKHLSLDERRAITVYTDHYYQRINPPLYEGRATPELLPFVGLLNAALDKALNYSGPLSRGVRFETQQQIDDFVALHRHHLAEGTPVVYPGFTSMSEGERPAMRNAPIELQLALGTGGVLVRPLSRYPKQNEVLFRAGYAFTVVSVEQRGGRWIIEIEEVSHD